jgi:O-acetyl-ADP-ribose deacetylase (regulator of RNase III)
VSLEVVVSDITALAVDAIVNAANSTLLGGGGVDGAIHDAAGPELREACRPLAPCPAGEARITAGFALTARYVIHTVGPVWRGGEHDEAAPLAIAHGVRTIAFPAISTGAYRYPLDGACEIAARTVRAFLADHARGAPERIVFCMFGAPAADAMRAALR